MFNEATGFAQLHNLLSQGSDFLGANHFPPINGVTVSDVLGQGATSYVYRGILTDTKESVAIKHVSEQYLEQAANELKILKSLKNDHIPTIPLNDLPQRVVVLSPVLLPVMSVFTPRDAQQLITALEYVHQQANFHRDIRPATVMKSEEGKIFLVDFGFAIRQNDAAASPYAGTLTTASTRVLQELSKTKKVGFLVADDVQSLVKTVYLFVTADQLPSKSPAIHQELLRFWENALRLWLPALQAGTLNEADAALDKILKEICRCGSGIGAFPKTNNTNRL